jgi:prefoldin subunit 5
MRRGIIISVCPVLVTVISSVLLPGCGIQSSLGEVNQNLVGLRSDLDTLRQSVDRIAALDAEIDEGVQRLGAVQSSLSDLDQEIQTVAISMRDLRSDLEAVRQSVDRITRIEKEIDSGIQRLDTVQTSLAANDGQEDRPPCTFRGPHRSSSSSEARVRSSNPWRFERGTNPGLCSSRFGTPSPAGAKYGRRTSGLIESIELGIRRDARSTLGSSDD